MMMFMAEKGAATSESKTATVVFDAENKILGRLASSVAKSALMGNNVAIINAEDAVLSGDPKVIIARYRTRMDLKEKSNPDHSPYWPRRPDMLVKRIVRGMLPYRKPRGKEAYRRIRVYMGVPEELKNSQRIEIDTKDPKKLYVKYMTVSQLSKMLGYVPGG
jgi:large subunit ribosomal protein L13